MFADKAVELEIGNIEKRLAGGNVLVDHCDQLDALLVVKLAAVLVHAFEIDGRLGSGLVVAGFEAPDVEPVGGTGAVDAKEVEADGNPLVDVFLNDLRGND